MAEYAWFTTGDSSKQRPQLSSLAWELCWLAVARGREDDSESYQWAENDSESYQCSSQNCWWKCIKALKSWNPVNPHTWKALLVKDLKTVFLCFSEAILCKILTANLQETWQWVACFALSFIFMSSYSSCLQSTLKNCEKIETKRQKGRR